MAADRRVAAITRHLTSALALEEGTGAVAQQTACSTCDPALLYRFITRDNLELRQEIFEFLKDDLYRPKYYVSLMEFRELTLQRLKKFVSQQFFSVQDYLEDPLRFQAALECIAYADYSLSIKAGVHFTLCGGTIAKLGTAKHHKEYFHKLDTLELPGCFGMTELGHGSNVMGIETTAVYDKQAGEFVVNTPTTTASKFWIGGAAQHGKVCTVFAQLTVNGTWEGPHVFVVRIRDDNGRLMPGVRIEDHGPKAGLNGVDNGQIWFNHVRVKRDAMLDAFASVDAEGNYSSTIKSVSQRFGTMVGGLTTGRLLIAQSAVDASKIGVCIAIAYAAKRPQFGDKRIIEYLTHQRRLFPSLATTYAMQFAMLRLKEYFVRRDPADAKTMHVMSAGLKAGATWSRVEVLQLCRECCGGQGFLAENKIGPMKNDMDVDVTFEGDNTVMMQQVAKALLDTAMASPRVPATPQLNITSELDLAHISQLLKYRVDALTGEIATAMGGAMRKAMSQGKAAAAAAANAAFEENLDEVVALGWANTELTAYQCFKEEAAGSPPCCQGPLQLLCHLYGLTRLERSLAFYLAHGALAAQHAALIRAAVNGACAQLAGNGAEVALRLCAGFGVPEHLLQAPIAKDWTTAFP